MTELTQPIENDSFLNLLDELRDELTLISTENIASDNSAIEEAVINCEGIVDALCADLVAQQDHKSAGFTHVSKALPVNTLNNDVLYIGINRDGFSCVFNYLSSINVEHHRTIYHTCYYIIGDERQQQMNGLEWWKILKKPTKNDLNEQNKRS